MRPHLLRGGEVIDDRDAIIAELTSRVGELQAELDQKQELEDVLRRERRVSDAAIGDVRRQLEPLYHALQTLFSSIDSVALPQASPRNAAVWESWKLKLGGLPARFIDALLVHGPMTRTQLRIVVGCASSSVADTIYKLNRAGLIDKANGKVALKETL
jgi:hypothetical protein